MGYEVTRFVGEVDVLQELYLMNSQKLHRADIHTQTDAFLDRPPTPLFIPAKTGIDATTQIEEGEDQIPATY